jgi:hypothetical protein
MASDATIRFAERYELRAFDDHINEALKKTFVKAYNTHYSALCEALSTTMTMVMLVYNPSQDAVAQCVGQHFLGN